MLKLANPYTMVVSGQTGSGKTEFAKRLIQNQAEIHQNRFTKIIIVYSIMQPVYREIEKTAPNIILSEGLPDNLLDDVASNEGDTLLVIDDMMIELENDKRLPILFTKMRHVKVSTIFIVQNFYFRSRYMITITRNAQYLVIFPNIRDTSMIQTLGRQMFPHTPKFLTDAFEQATSSPFGYLFIDCKPNTRKEYRVRDRIFPNDTTRFYVPEMINIANEY
jgi:hypothetical protein